MKIALAGQGAFGTRHLEAIQNIPDIEVISLTGGRPPGTEAVAKKWSIPHWTTDLTETLKQPGLEAVILASPTQVHADQAEPTAGPGGFEVETGLIENEITNFAIIKSKSN